METKNDNPMVLNDYRLSDPEHPGIILQEELKSRGIRQKDFCAQIGVQPSFLSALIHGNRNITAEIASRLERALDIPATVWLNLQNLYDLERLSPERQPATRPYPLRTPSFAGAMMLRDETAIAAERPVATTLSVTLPPADADILYTLASRLNWKVE